MSKAMEAAELAVKLEQHKPGQGAHVTARDALKLMRLAASLRGIHVRECNGYGQFAGSLEARDRSRRARLAAVVTETLALYGLKWTHNTDPRGAAVGILFPDGSYNTMGGKEEGWRI